MAKALRRAKREDKKLMKAIDEEQQQAQVHQYFEGENQEQTKMNTQFVAATWMRKIRDKYRGSVIRRTVNSLDYTGMPISRLDPYEQHRCVINLHDHEIAALEELATNALDGEAFANTFASEVTCTTLLELGTRLTDYGAI